MAELTIQADITVNDVTISQPECRDWLKTQYPATFKFREFATESDVKIGGRRIVVHEFPSREWWYVEDLGRRVETVEVIGYIFGENADVRAEEFFAVCCSPGPGLLTLPLRPPRLACCVNAVSNFLKDELGRFTFELSFVIEPLSVGAVFSVIGLANAAQRAASAATDTVSDLFHQRFDALSAPAVARNAAVTTIGLAGAALDDARKSVRISSKQAYARAEVRARRIKLDANDLAYMGDLASRTDDTVFVNSQVVAQTNFATAFVDATAVLSQHAEPIDMAHAMKTMSDFTPNDPTSAVDTTSIEAEQALIDAAAALVRRIGLLRWTEALTKIRFASRAAAVTAKAELTQKYEAELETVDDANVERALRNALNAAIDYLARTATDLPADRKVRLAKPMPCAVLAYKFFGKADRDEEIIDRNAVWHPLYSPLDITAAAK